MYLQLCSSQLTGGFMITSKNKTLKSILDSKTGLHLTTYIKFDGNAIRFRKKLNDLLKTAKDHLSQVLSVDEQKRFLAPVEALGLDTSTLKQMKGNIAIFRKNDFLRFVSVPIDIQETCVVADTFHIKPLVKWAQQDQEFLVVGLTFDGAHIFKGSQSELKKIDSAVYPESLKRWDNDGGYSSLKEKRQHNAELQHTMEWLAGWVDDLVKGVNTTVFVAGNKDYVKAFIKNFNSDKLYPETIAPHFSLENAYDVCKNVRALLRLDSAAKLNQTLEQFDLALKSKTVKTNLFQIAKAAISGKVEKLIVAEDLNVFGKMDQATGGIALHPKDMNHEDDCLLDDLAQTVLLKGGEVTVVKRSEIPRGLPVMAVLSGRQSELYAEASRPIEIAV